MEYITKKEEILDSIQWSNFSYEYEIISIHNIDIPTLKITVIDGSKKIQMQPFVLGEIPNIENISRSLWVLNHSKRPEQRNTILRNFSLKLDVIKPIFESIIDNKRYKHIFEIGSTDSFVSEEIIKKVFSEKYIGLDIVTPPNSNNTAKRPCVQGLSEQLPFVEGAFDFALVSMTLLNIVRPDVAFSEISRVLNNRSTVIIIDINSNYYKACGFYKKEGSEYSFTKILSTQKSFFTLKTLGRDNFFIHCYHHFDLYKDFLCQHNFGITKDFVFGPTVETILDRSQKPQKDIESFARYIQYQPFHLVEGQRS
ncbi:methylase involved in ubiquinone/menaquinone biosynthesis [Desulfocapsa sulfexigens DSM 10523]|uniref:Methylase involved in ubiquinone/menaquinone biosynthesis n=1 Tax=Desulfocapsa sulfexigens (strain DSM 10523 / SB164P1) TaxID=1167006 RepID=M1PBB8_DESSD|nr:methyltransferase domain-containing protein [Desulfocapsa sulfexigens]AGF77045.1 methylase involved in ubiquinone/menaquinone biosynthesis [Desulfocapsa sulfexigens DSM 10523]